MAAECDQSDTRVKAVPNYIAWSCALAVFLGAFLLFQVQPLISKTILPWFGGSPAVWTTCMLFFQVLLLAGYVYADRMSRVTSPFRQAAIHVPLLLLACLTLPITRAEEFKPTTSNAPLLDILKLLALTVGLPYMMVSTTGPLVQTWFARVYPERSPYRLYALSNLGSLLALLSYPVVVEPLLPVHAQGLIWSGGFLAFSALTGYLVVVHASRTGRTTETPLSTGDDVEARARSAASFRLVPWLLLPALASLMLLAVTNQLCQNVAVVPFLWIAPLSVYLCSFIICFDRARWYAPRWYALGAACSVAVISRLLLAKHFTNSVLYVEPPLVRWLARSQLVQITTYLIGLFLICMVCHGEAVRAKPPSRQLTSFYLAIAAGGAIGGLFVALICPHLFSTYLELNLGLIVSLCVAVVVLYRAGRDNWFQNRLSRGGFCLVAVLGSITVIGAQVSSLKPDWLVARRNFYGVLTVTEDGAGQANHSYSLFSGASMEGGITQHGQQYTRPDLRREPTLYYTAQSGVGLTLRNLTRPAGRHVGIIGLGVGTVAVYGTPLDQFRFYEINPLVEEMACTHFTFLEDSAAEIRVLLGDGRALLEREPPQGFDVLVVDAFSGDAIPTHLLTREAFSLYLTKHLQPLGVLAIHVSNRYVNLIPVVARLAAHFQVPCVLVSNRLGGLNPAPSDWLLLTRNEQFLSAPEIAAAAQWIPTRATTGALWTDQQNNLFQLLVRGPRYLRQELKSAPRLSSTND